jgi:hypothetical protein
MVNPPDPIPVVPACKSMGVWARERQPGSNTPSSASNPGITPPVRGHIGEIRRSGHTGVRGQNRMKYDRTQRPQVADMIGGNALPSPAPSGAGEGEGVGVEIVQIGLWRYLRMRI